MQRKRIPLRVRFERQLTFEPNTGCWLWLGSVNQNGYGMIANFTDTKGWRPTLAHRVAWMLYRGDISATLGVLHKCDVACCVNPDHLFIGTQKDNMADAAAKSRVKNQFRDVTHCIHGHALTGSNVRMIPRGRQCVTCARARSRKWNRRHEKHV